MVNKATPTTVMVMGEFLDEGMFVEGLLAVGVRVPTGMTAAQVVGTARGRGDLAVAGHGPIVPTRSTRRSRCLRISGLQRSPSRRNPR